jgi:putative hydrolase of the HAD superfamily
MNRDLVKIKTCLKDIRVISVDVGFTLIYPEPAVGEVYAAVARRFGCSLNPRDVHSRFETTWKTKSLSDPQGKIDAFADEERVYQWWKDIFLSSLGDSVALGDVDKMFPHCFSEYARGAYWRLYPEVLQTLTALGSLGFRLVALSNWDRRLLQTLKDLRLDPFFEKIYISTLIGYAKPDPGAFRYAAQDLNVPPQQILHIGDSWEEDILGAQRAGIRPVYLDRTGKNKASHAQTPIITSLDELLFASGGPEPF